MDSGCGHSCRWSTVLPGAAVSPAAAAATAGCASSNDSHQCDMAQLLCSRHCSSHAPRGYQTTAAAAAAKKATTTGGEPRSRNSSSKASTSRISNSSSNSNSSNSNSTRCSQVSSSSSHFSNSTSSSRGSDAKPPGSNQRYIWWVNGALLELILLCGALGFLWTSCNTQYDWQHSD